MDNKHYKNFQLPNWFHAPNELVEAIELAWKQVNDPARRKRWVKINNSLIEKIQSTFIEKWQEQMFLLALPMAMQAQRRLTLESEGELADAAMKRIQIWFNERQKIAAPLAAELFPSVGSKVPGHEWIGEAYGILRDTMLCTDPELCAQRVHSVVHLALTGSSMWRDDQGRTDFFNWYLIDVIPSAYSLQLPAAYYNNEWPMDFDDPLSWTQNIPRRIE